MSKFSAALAGGRRSVLMFSGSVLAAGMILSACSTPGNGGPNPTPDPSAPLEALTYAEYLAFAEELNDELLQVIDDFTATPALELLLNHILPAYGPFPPGETGESVLLPRGEWKLRDVYDWDFDFVRRLEGPGELRFTTKEELWIGDAEEPREETLAYSVDWQPGNTDTVFVEYEGQSVELPKSMTAAVKHDGKTLLDVTVEEVGFATGEIEDCWEGQYEPLEFLFPTKLRGNGSLGNSSLPFVTGTLDFDAGAGTAESIGTAGLKFAAHTLSLEWDASLKTPARGDFLSGLQHILQGCNDVPVEQFTGTEITATATATVNDLGFAADIKIELDANEQVNVEIKVTINDRSTFTISGTADLTADEPLTGVLARFSDRNVNIEQFVEDSADLLTLGFYTEFDY